MGVVTLGHVAPRSERPISDAGDRKAVDRAGDSHLGVALGGVFREGQGAVVGRVGVILCLRQRGQNQKQQR